MRKEKSNIERREDRDRREASKNHVARQKADEARAEYAPCDRIQLVKNSFLTLIAHRPATDFLCFLVHGR